MIPRAKISTRIIHNIVIVLTVMLSSIISNVLVPLQSQAATTNFYLYEASKSVVENSQISVAIRINATAQAADLVSVKLTYPASKLELIGGVNYTNSAFAIPALETLSAGSIVITRGTLPPAVNTDALIATLTFKVISGTSSVDFLPSSAAYFDGEIISGGSVGGTYTAVAPPTAPPPTPSPAPPSPSGGAGSTSPPTQPKNNSTTPKKITPPATNVPQSTTTTTTTDITPSGQLEEVTQTFDNIPRDVNIASESDEKSSFSILKVIGGFSGLAVLAITGFFIIRVIKLRNRPIPSYTMDSFVGSQPYAQAQPSVSLNIPQDPVQSINQQPLQPVQPASTAELMKEYDITQSAPAPGNIVTPTEPPEDPYGRPPADLT